MNDLVFFNKDAKKVCDFVSNKNVVTNQIVLDVGYDIENLTKWCNN